MENAWNLRNMHTFSNSDSFYSISPPLNFCFVLDRISSLVLLASFSGPNVYISTYCTIQSPRTH